MPVMRSDAQGWSFTTAQAEEGRKSFVRETL
jgi:hypothetical protein